jgi:hypothetical protein
MSGIFQEDLSRFYCHRRYKNPQCTATIEKGRVIALQRKILLHESATTLRSTNIAFLARIVNQVASFTQPLFYVT